MAKSKNQKLKLIYLMEFLWKQTDQEHVVSMREIIEYMKEKGITAERKSIYDDMATLKKAGWDIDHRREHPCGYYLKRHIFDSKDLHKIVHAIRSSNLLTERKSEEIVDGIKYFCSQWEAQELDGKIYVIDRITAIHESISLKIDEIHKAIAMDREISFHYAGKKKEGEALSHHVSPWAVVFDAKDYKLVGYEEGELHVFYIREMNYIRITSEVRKGNEAFQEWKSDGR